MSKIDKCVCCGEVIPEGAQVCPKCLTSLEPPAKYLPGQLVKMRVGDEWYYNHIVDSYFNREINMRMYRLNERIAMPVYREDWLELVGATEVDHVSTTGKLMSYKNGGWRHPIEEVTK